MNHGILYEIIRFLLSLFTMAALIVTAINLVGGIRMRTNNPMGGTDNSLVSARRIRILIGLAFLALTIILCGGSWVVLLMI
jgi:Mn2+/Fe2+ NRAMP family transporter